MPSNADLGRAIRRLRREQRLTINDLAHRADVHPTYLSGIERGLRNPTWSKLIAVAEALESSMATVVHEAETESQLMSKMRSIRSELGLPL
jgi:transcriptional regulator with XRE-family HTH domain